ncbi:cytochrome C [Maritimibacter sp. UBA3975]|uniref:c-type cytochrome n=1 Tax=Maritimibacter sp. UBA3975 TaxID=1946833 RepID=UPI000C09A0F8|nr:cytochrome C [Maritimibacter sp. UBA3975]MAM62919.1 cytochrome C [Maritimibacter sp.]|tara:strand:- start:5075 stop:5512 length:438 start_codon:yes stop_codon:yes gene_type:complete
MKTLYAGLAGALLIAPAAFAQDAGDPAAGEDDFRQCRSCHSIQTDEGDDIVKGGRTGPNLYGIVGRQAGTFEDFSYSDAMVAAGEQGLEWNVDDFTVYVQDPTAFLRDYTGDDSARGKMTFKLRQAEKAADLWAYLESVGPDAES